MILIIRRTLNIRDDQMIDEFNLRVFHLLFTPINLIHLVTSYFTDYILHQRRSQVLFVFLNSSFGNDIKKTQILKIRK